MGELERPLHRDREIEKLRLMLTGAGAGAGGGEGSAFSVPSAIFINGLAAAGKTHVIKWVLETECIQHAVFHCVELYNIRLMLESIVFELTGSRRKCENISEFVSILRQELNPSQVYVILFEEAERFRDVESHFRQVFSQLPELTGQRVCCIWESRLDWSRMLPARDLPNPVIIHVPQYTKVEITDLLVAQLPGDKPVQFNRDYIALVLSIFYLVTRSVSELSHIALLHYSDYCRPVEAGECGPSDIKKLWFNIEKQLNRCLSTVHLREVASQQITEMMNLKEELDKEESGVGTAVVSQSNTRASVELPFYSKFLLISAYLASYNPQKTDKRFFVKHHGKQRKTASSIKAKEKFNSQLTGPKPFPLERMLAIFYNIIEERVNPTANIYSQISSLARLQLITSVGIDQIEQPKYKCNVNFEFIRQVSKTVQFDVNKYLYTNQ